MRNQSADLPLINTKLYRPPVAGDFVPRVRRVNQLNSKKRPLTLVSAPPGFGKSTLLSAWLAEGSIANAWLSLDNNDNDPAVFLAYFVAALQTIVPDACPQSAIHARASTLPALPLLAATLINEIAALEREFVLVLDDYHLIHEQTVHALLAKLLEYPPPNMRLVLATRRDPALPLVQLRAKSKLAELRAEDLRFTEEETAVYLQSARVKAISDGAVARLGQQTEGWIAGLHLAVLSLRNSSDPEAFVEALPRNRYIMDYLLEEVLLQQPQEMQDNLLKTAALDRFCASLIQAVCENEHASRLLPWLEENNLFLVALDQEGEWFRYHHLFQELLSRLLLARGGEVLLKALHGRASAWFGEQRLVEEAIKHALAADDVTAAVGWVARYRHEALNREQWPRLRRWLRHFAPEVIDNNPDLLLAQAWTVQNEFRLAATMQLVERVESLLPSGAADTLLAEISALRSEQGYWDGDADRALQWAQRALALAPATHLQIRGFALLYLGGGYQMRGDATKSRHLFGDALEANRGQVNTLTTRLLIGTAFVASFCGDLERMAQAARQLLAVGQQERLIPSIGWANYFLGAVAYQNNDLAAAQKHFAAIYDYRYTMHLLASAQNSFGLARVLQAQGEPEAAEEVVAAMLRQAIETNNVPLITQTQAFSARLALLQGRLDDAEAWAAEASADRPLGALVFPEHPLFILALVCLAQNTAPGRKEAAKVLQRLRAQATRTHNTARLIEITAAQALLLDAQGKERLALEKASAAVSLAYTGRYLRLFVDLGPAMQRLLRALPDDHRHAAYVGRILAAFGDVAEPAIDALLTPREMEILELLGNRLTNKEIAAQLYISPLTVKRHTVNIYRKMNVNGRRRAVLKARELGILPGAVPSQA